MKKSLFGAAALGAMLVVSAGIIGCANDVEPQGGGGPESFSPLKSGDLSLPFLTKKEIKDQMAATEYTLDVTTKPDSGEDYMKTLATYTEPYNVGELKQEVLDRALARVNLIRRLSGLNKVVLDPEFVKQAQHGAWLMTKENSLDHYLLGNKNTDTSYMSAEFKEYCRMGTELANIYRRPNPTRCVDSFMGENGVPSLGHRWNVIGRHITSVGFGGAQTPEGKTQFGFGSMRFNMAAKPVEGITLLENRGTNWELTSWPTPGYFPANTPWFDVNSGLFWHFATNDRYQMDDKTKITVTQQTGENGAVEATWVREITGVTRNAKGEVTARTVTKTENENGDFRVTDPRTCIFTLGLPANVYQTADDVIFKVKIENVQVRNDDGTFSDTSARKTLEYGVCFFDLKKVN